MKLFVYILFIIFTFFSCTRTSKTNNQTVNKSHHNISAKQTNQQNSVDTTTIDPNTLGCLVTHYVHGYDPEQFTPGTFNKTTYVYNSPKSGAKIIDTLPFNTAVNILKAYTGFYLVCTSKAKSGYIKKTDLYLNKILGRSSQSDYCHYLIGITKYAKEAEHDDNSLTCEASVLKFLKVDDKSGKILNSYADSVYGGDYGIKEVYSVALKNAKAIFHVTYNCFHDIETDADLFVIDNDKEISRLIYEEGSGDGGDGDFSDIYLPVTLQNGKKVVLAKNGELTLDPTTAKPEIYPYPADCGAPIDELVVVQNWSEEAPEDGQPEYNPDGTEFNNKTMGSTILYRWDGNKLHKIKIIETKPAH